MRNLIRDSKSHQIKTVIQTGGKNGMQTMEQALVDLVRRGAISRDLAIQRASDPDEVVRQLDRGR